MKSRIQRKSFFALCIGALICPNQVQAQEEFTLGTNNTVNEAPEAEAPVDDFGVESESLFNGEDSAATLNTAPKEPEAKSQKSQGIGKTVVKKVEVLPQTEALPPAGQTVSAPPAKAPLVPVAIPPSVPPSVAEPLPEAVVAPIQATNAVATPSSVGALESAAPNPPIVVNKPLMEAPLTTDGSPAPVKAGDLRVPNDFAGAPPVPGTRRNLARGEAPELYLVEEGDTLFDVCSQLIDDGNYWPRLWSLNPDIRNPHFIYPGSQLTFYAGDAENPPFLDVVTEDEMVPVEKGAAKESELVAQEVPLKSHEEVESIPTGDDQAEIIGPDQLSVDSEILESFIMGGGEYTSDDVVITVPGFLLKEELDPLGILSVGSQGEVMAGDGKRIVILEAAKLSTGTFSILRPRGKVSHPESGDMVGWRYDFVGNVHVDRNINSDVREGELFSTHLGAQAGDVVVNYVSTRRVLANGSSVGPTSTADATIVAFGGDGQAIGGAGTPVFLDKGGLATGSYLSIFGKSRYGDIVGGGMSSENISTSAIGILRIVDASDVGAVGVIIKNTAEVGVGDNTSGKF